MNFGPHDCIENVLSTELSPNMSDMNFRNLFVLPFSFIILKKSNILISPIY